MKKNQKKWNYQDLLNYYSQRFLEYDSSIDKVYNYYRQIKSRYWAFIVYPESANPRWKDLLIQYGIKFAVSPLHDKDIKSDHIVTDEDNNIMEIETKKEHYHVLMAFGNTTTYRWVNQICKAAQGIFPVPVSSVRSYYEYLTHKNETDPDKFHYEEEPNTYNGFSIKDFIGESNSERDEILQFIEKVIEEQNIMNYYTLVNYLKSQQYTIEARVCRSSITYLQAYIYHRKHLFDKDNESKQQQKS